MPCNARAKAVAVPPRIHQFGLTGVALRPTCSPLQLVKYSPRQHGSLVGQRAHSVRFSWCWAHPDVRGCRFAPKTGAQSAGPLDHQTTERTSPRADLESCFRRAARGIVERVPGVCVSAETTTRRDFPRKSAKKSRVSQPVVDALDRASIIAAQAGDTRSVWPRESRTRTWERLHFCWFDDTFDVLPLTPGKIRAVSALLKHRGSSSGMAYISVVPVPFSNWDPLLTILQTSNVQEPSDQFSGESVRQPDKSLPLHLDESASLP